MPSYYSKIRKPGTLEDLKVKLWRAVDSADKLLERAQTSEEATKAIHALVQAGQSYCKVLLGADVEARLRTLEEAEQARAARQPMRKVQ